MATPVATERTLRAVLRYMVDPRGVREVKQSTDDLETQLQDLRSSFYELSEPIQDLGMVASQFEAIGFEIQDYGRRITDTFSTYAEEYIGFAEGATETSKEWIAATEKLENAQRRFGGVAAQSMLPLMKVQAEIVDQATKFAEKYPEIAQIAFGIGTAVILASSLANAVAKGIRLVADIKLIALETQRVLAARMMRDAANKQIAAAAIMQAAAKEGGAVVAGKTLTQMGGIRGSGSMLAGKIAGAVGGALPAVAIVASIAAIVGLGIAIKNLSDDVEEGQEQVATAWQSNLKRSVEETDSAVEVVERYRQKQAEISKIHDEGGIIADLFVKKSRIMHATLKEVKDAIEDSANSYEDYQTAVERYNSTLDKTEKPLAAVSKETYLFRIEARDLAKELRAGRASLIEYAKLLMEEGNIREQMVGMTLYAMAMAQQEQKLTEMLDDWVEFNEETDRLSGQYEADRIAAWDEFNKAMADLDKETITERERILSEWENASTKIEIDTASERERIAAEAGEDLAEIEERIGQQRENAMNDFMSEMADAEEDYYAERTEAAAEHGIEVQRAEADHQKEMRRMREDSELRQRGAIRSRDAIALLEEKRDYERERGRAEQDFGIDMTRRNQDYARQLQQMEAAFAEQQVSRMEAFAEQQKELEKQLREEQKIRDDATEEETELLEASRVNELRELYDSKEEQLGTLEDENTKQEVENKRSLSTRLTDSKTSWLDGTRANKRQLDQRLRDQGFWNSKELVEYQRFRDQSLTTLRSFVSQANIALQGLNTPQSTPTFGTRAGGGYTGFGLFRMGEEGDEYVMDNPTTRAAERMLGGKLSQEGILAGMAAGRTGSAKIEQSFTFVGRLSPDEKAEYKQIAYEQSLRALNDVMDEVK